MKTSNKINKDSRKWEELVERLKIKEAQAKQLLEKLPQNVEDMQASDLEEDKKDNFDHLIGCGG